MRTNPRNKNWNSVVVVPLSTSLKNIFLPFHKLIPKGKGGLTQDSHARCDLISNLDKIYLDPQGPLGAPLSDKFIWEIVKGIRAVIGDNPYL
jgi:mRNA-degrading endonuclease toxin of MazEF toxin-antitoxin module